MRDVVRRTIQQKCKYMRFQDLSTSAARKGFGSFHSEDIELLIRQRDEQYSRPELYDEILSKLKEKNDAIVSGFEFGREAKNSLFALGILLSICNVVYCSELYRLQYQISINTPQSTIVTLSYYFLTAFTDDEWTFINHGAFGATLSPLLEESNLLRLRCEAQPLRFYDRELLPMIAHSVRETAKFINCPPEELVPLQNVTSGKISTLEE